MGLSLQPCCNMFDTFQLTLCLSWLSWDARRRWRPYLRSRMWTQLFHLYFDFPFLTERRFSSAGGRTSFSGFIFTKSSSLLHCLIIACLNSWSDEGRALGTFSLNQKWLPRMCECHYAAIFMRPYVKARNACQPKFQIALLWRTITTQLWEFEKLHTL